jgi:hypothetical protein
VFVVNALAFVIDALAFVIDTIASVIDTVASVIPATDSVASAVAKYSADCPKIMETKSSFKIDMLQNPLKIILKNSPRKDRSKIFQKQAI